MNIPSIEEYEVIELEWAELEDNVNFYLRDYSFWKDMSSKNIKGYRLYILNTYLSLFENIIANKVFNFIERIMNRYEKDKIGIMGISDLKEFLSYIGTIFKKLGNRIDKICGFSYMIIVNIEYIYGYKYKIDKEQFEESIREWVSVKKYDAWYLSALDKEIGIYMKENFQGQNQRISVMEFLFDRDKWATDGSSYKSGYLTYEYNGKTEKIKMTKRDLANRFEIHQLLTFFWDSEHVDKNGAIAKAEINKTRSVISGDFVTYLRMAYISYIVESRYSGKNIYSLLDKQEQMLFWLNATRSYNYIGFPFDQGKFDQNISKEMIMSCFRAMYKLIETWFGIDSEEYSVMKLIEKDINFSTIYIENEEVSWEGGLLSGWRWTSMFGSIINLCQWYVFEKTYNTHSNYIATYKNLMVMGDDLTLHTNSYKMCIAYYNFMKLMGFNVNDKKIFVDRGRSEFLRKVINDDGTVLGYPARAMASILWRKPLSSKEMILAKNDLKGVLYNIRDKWMIIVSRLEKVVRKNNAMHLMMLHLNVYIKKNISDVKKLVRSPITVGGLGININWMSDEWMIIEEDLEVYKSIVQSKIKVETFLNAMVDSNYLTTVVYDIKNIYTVEQQVENRIASQYKELSKLVPSKIIKYNSKYITLDKELYRVLPMIKMPSAVFKSVKRAKALLRPRIKEESLYLKSNWLMSEILLEIDNKSYGNFETVKNLSNIVENLDVVKMIKSNWSRKNYKEWLVGRNPIVANIVSKYDDGFLSYFKEQIIERVMIREVHKRVDSYRLLNVNLTIEYLMGEYISDLEIFISK